jgi:hypothetical protein
MTAITFDTLAFAKKMRSVGFTEAQAEAQAEEIAKLLDEQLATKRDTESIKKEIENLRQEVRITEERLSYQLTIRLGIMLTAAVGLIATLIKLG